MKKSLLLILCLVLLSSLLVGCGKKNNTISDDDKKGVYSYSETEGDNKYFIYMGNNIGYEIFCQPDANKAFYNYEGDGEIVSIVKYQINEGENVTTLGTANRMFEKGQVTTDIINVVPLEVVDKDIDVRMPIKIEYDKGIWKKTYSDKEVVYEKYSDLDNAFVLYTF